MASDPLPDQGLHTSPLSSVVLLSVCGRCEGWEEGTQGRQGLVRGSGAHKERERLTVTS